MSSPTLADTEIARETDRRGGIGRVLGDLVLGTPAIVLLVIAVAIFATAEPRFASAYNIANIAEQSATLGLMTIGLAVVLLLGGIDLSVPAVMAAAAVLGALAMVATQNPWLGAAVMIGVGLLGGTVNAIAVAWLGLVPFAVTLATLTLGGGLAVWVTEGTSIYGMPYEFSGAVMARIAGVPVSVVVFVGVALVTHLVVSRGRIGRWLYAIGTNRRAAAICAMPERRVEFGAYVFAGLMAGIAAILLTARLDSAAATMGSEAVVLDVVSAAVIGGVSIYGGRGSIAGAAIGAVFVTVIGNGLNLLGFDYFTSIVIKGAIILLAIALDAALARRGIRA